MSREHRALLALLAAACTTRTPEPPAARVRLWHTFQPGETEALNEALVGRTPTVEPTLLPLHRGFSILLADLAEGATGCPDLVRIDATWLPALVERGLVVPVPDAVWAAADWLPEAVELAEVDGRRYALPQSIDGLLQIQRAGKARAVEFAARAPGSLGLRVDGYWLVSFLRARGAELHHPPAAALEAAMREFQALFAPGGPALTLPVGEEEREETRRFRAGQVEVAINGPWAFHRLSAGAVGELHVSALAGAPRGGALLVVPLCARHADLAWELGLGLTRPALQAEWAARFGLVPSTASALALSPPVVVAAYRVLASSARPLPRVALMPELFDDLTPALSAVVDGDASPAEAVAGVMRAWARLQARTTRVRL